MKTLKNFKPSCAESNLSKTKWYELENESAHPVSYPTQRHEQIRWTCISGCDDLDGAGCLSFLSTAANLVGLDGTKCRDKR